ncbi:MAG: hypothetical protein IKH57_25485 [Clostridia bacterium]|nr:hypothetical protein [Clostridia bacterium]
MSYTALEAMRKVNEARFGKDVGPFQPYLADGAAVKNDLKSAALRFLHNRCEGLRFSDIKSEQEKKAGCYLGTGLQPNQIPYNMQMDIDRLCLERELETFIDSGIAEDAYTVYYCWLEMFMGEYGRSQKMVELLSEYESNASSLLLSHRDHYSHSVYVFALGLAIYETNEQFRDTFNSFYGFEKNSDPHRAAAFFLEYWGLTALFHDIGYPFEIPFEQVISYFELNRKSRGTGNVFISYHDMEGLTAIDKDAQERFLQLFGRRFYSVYELLAYGISETLGEPYQVTESYLARTIENKPTHPEQFGYYMDHAFFSAARLYQEMVTVLGAEALEKAHVDALSAIMLHNSLYKFAIAFYKSGDPAKRKPPLKAAYHPLAYLLMLCDELQCWDRTAYGRYSRTELHPMAAEFDFTGGNIKSVYYYDQEEKQKISVFKEAYAAWEKGGREGNPPRLKAYSDMAEKEQRFKRDIEKIVDLSGINFTVDCALRKVDYSSKHTYLSASNFLHIYFFAVALNGRYQYQGKEDSVSTEMLEKEFDCMSLEYKLSNINQVKSFARYLDVVGCFYTDRPVDYEVLDRFSAMQIEVFAPLEHERWIMEHKAMGWTYGDLYLTVPLEKEDRKARKALREQLRQHQLCMDSWEDKEEIYFHYSMLSPEDQGKDWKPFNTMLKLIKKYDALKIYKLL